MLLCPCVSNPGPLSSLNYTVTSFRARITFVVVVVVF